MRNGDSSKKIAAIAFFLAWLWQWLAAIIYSKYEIFLGLLGFGSVLVAFIQANLFVGIISQSNHNNLFKEWLRFFGHVIVICIPFSFLFGAMAGLFFQALGYDSYSGMAGTITLLPSLAISTYIALAEKSKNDFEKSHQAGLPSAS
jgi:hypothetical protein